MYNEGGGVILMKRLQYISILFILIFLMGCIPTNALREESPVLEKRVYETLEEINISDTIPFKKQWEKEIDNMVLMVFSADYKKVHFDLMIGLDLEDDEYSVIAIGDFGDLSNLDHFGESGYSAKQIFNKLYWVFDEVRELNDVYDWETNELLIRTDSSIESLENKIEDNDKIEDNEIETANRFRIPEEYQAMFEKSYADLGESERAFVTILEAMANSITGENQLENYLDKDDYDKYILEIYRLLIEKKLFEYNPYTFESIKDDYTRLEDDGILIHEDGHVNVYYLGFKMKQGTDYIVFYIDNKTDVELTFQTSTFGIDGESFGFGGSEQVAAQSKGTIQFFKTSPEGELPTMEPKKISGTIRVIDFSRTKIKKSYDVTFSNIEVID